ncbi:MAG: hypothetical protein KDN19_11485 [Verrucomicrobiae bacterium]|nr:hypothetical protein [Verrucomicrobiae bacterium]
MSLTPSQPEPAAIASGRSGRDLLVASKNAQRTDWNRIRKVEVGFDGEWSTFPTLTQKVLTDPEYRGSSEEIYWPGRDLVVQVHRGPGGTKTVRRLRGESIEVSYNGEPSDGAEVEAASALVADAYAMFLFGASWLLDHGEDFRYLGNRDLEGSECQLVEVDLEPGIGLSGRDRAVAWLDAESGLMRRVTFTLNGLESTQGAEVDVTMSEFLTGPDGSQWPGHFVEMIRKPVNTKAHDWRTTSLVVDGVKVE